MDYPRYLSGGRVLIAIFKENLNLVITQVIIDLRSMDYDRVGFEAKMTRNYIVIQGAGPK